MKICSRCKVNKNLAEFHVDPRYRLGVTGHCRSCRAEAIRLWKEGVKLLPKPDIGAKRCAKCLEWKPVSDFSRSRVMTDGYKSRCKVCVEAGRVVYRMNPTRALKQRLRHYGMTPEDLFAMIEAQDGRCAICQEKFFKPVIDHDHRTGLVRALLCNRCNCRVAVVEDEGFLRQARSYLAVVTPTRFKIDQKWWEACRAHAAKAAARRRE